MPGIPPSPSGGLRVERCPACGARYNVTRLATGTRFSCRRCGGVVTVTDAAETLAQRPTERGSRLALVAASLVLLAGAALRSLPGAYAGEAGAPWGTLSSALSLPDAAGLGLTALAGLLALVAGARRGPRVLTSTLAVLLLVLFLRSHGPSTPALRLRAPDLATAAALALLGAGALSLGSRRSASRARARPFLVVGVALLAASALAQFPAGSAAPALDAPATPVRANAPAGASTAVARFEALRALATALREGKPLPDSAPVWTDALAVVAAALSLLLVLLPGREGGFVSRLVGRASFVLLLSSVVGPSVVELASTRETWLGAGGGTRLASGVASIVLDDGLGLWLALAATAAALAAAEPPASPRGTARSGVAHLLAALAAAGAVALLANPDRGVLARALPWDLLAEGRATEAAVVVALLGLLVAAAALGTLVPPLRGRGTFALAAAAAAACASDLAVSTAGVPRFAFAALVAVAAGALLARRGAAWDGRGRAAALVPAITLVLLLVFPEGPPSGDGVLPYPCGLSSVAAAFVDATSGRLRPMDWMMDPSLAPLTLAAAGAAIALVAAVVGPRGPLVLLAVLVAAALALHGPASAVFASTQGPRGLEGLLAALAAAALAVRQVPAPSVFGAMAGAADAVGGRPRGFAP